jgi:hypothetical protein
VLTDNLCASLCPSCAIYNACSASSPTFLHWHSCYRVWKRGYWAWTSAFCASVAAACAEAATYCSVGCRSCVAWLGLLPAPAGFSDRIC